MGALLGRVLATLWLVGHRPPARKRREFGVLFFWPTRTLNGRRCSQTCPAGGPLPKPLEGTLDCTTITNPLRRTSRGQISGWIPSWTVWDKVRITPFYPIFAYQFLTLEVGRPANLFGVDNKPKPTKPKINVVSERQNSRLRVSFVAAREL